ncbi:MAG: SUMF1/EgtB/PvdO family nonheme iron enzyme [Myxococcota bacterium]
MTNPHHDAYSDRRRLPRVTRLLCSMVGMALCPACFEVPDPVDLTVGATETETETETDGLIDTTADETTATTDEGPHRLPPVEAECGNGQLDPGEQCDGDDEPQTCAELGYGEGIVSCVGCQFDASACGPPVGMLSIPGGVFEMGSTLSDDEQLVRDVHVSEFWIDQSEVTAGDYAQCVAQGACPEFGTGLHCNGADPLRQDHPINCVDWSSAQAYCGWVDGGIKRLPTEAEWEKAARGTDARVYPWGDAPEPSCSMAIMDDPALQGIGCGADSTFPVGSRPLGASPYGALDMAGNVIEWVADWLAPYEMFDAEDPAGPTDGIYRVIRGGSWASADPSGLQTFAREGAAPITTSTIIGFRCAATPPSAP